jgi:hypothetical protein
VTAYREPEAFFHRFEQFREADTSCIARQSVAAFHTAVTRDKSLRAKLFQDVCDEVSRQVELLCDGASIATGFVLVEVR